MFIRFAPTDGALYKSQDGAILALNRLALETNRTQADLADLKRLLSRAGSLTDEENSEFTLARHKGAYNYTDLNRVTEAMEYLDGIFSDRGYVTGYKRVKAVWYAEDVPTVSQMQQYLSNVVKLKAVVSEGVSTTVPVDMVGLTLEEANNIEQILIDVDTLLTALAAVYLRSGMVWAYSGGAGFYFMN